MGGRSFDARNKQLPAAVEAMASDPPACFDSKIWRLFLVECYRGALNAPGERARMDRGQRPDYCADCARAHREQMLKEGRCKPQTLAPLLADMAEDVEADLCPAR